MTKVLSITITWLFISCCGLFAKDINGKVYEDNSGKKQPLIGANVFWHNTTIGAATDINGNFKIEQHKSARLLIATFIGYMADTIKVTSDNQVIEFVLKPNTQLEEVVVSARRSGSHLSKIEPILTQNITGAELCKAACCNLSESFETNASVDVSFSDAVSGAKQIHLLGLAGTYVQMMTENIPNLNGLATPYGLGYIPGSWMEAIQISKGTSSVKNGYEAITGQINVEYKKPYNSEKFFINAFASSSGKYETNVNSSVLINDKLSSMILFHAEDMSVSHDDNNDGFVDMPKTRQYNFINRWHYKVGKGYDARFGIKLLKEDRSGGQMNHDNSMGDKYNIDINTNRFELFSKSSYIFHSNKNASIALIASFTNHDQKSEIGLRHYDANQKSIYTNLLFQSNLGTGDVHKYVVGSSFKYDMYDETFIGNNTLANIIVPGFFAEYTFMPSKNFTALVGARADFHNEFGTFFTPRLHLKYNPFESTHIRTSIGKGFRRSILLAENTRYIASARQFVIPANLDLMEEAVNYGINITQYINIGDSRKLSFSGEYYHTQFLNKVVTDLDSNPNQVIFSNLNGDAFSDNFQIEMNTMPIENLELTVAYRYNIVKETINDILQEKPLVSRYKGLFNVSYSTNMKIWQFDFTAQLNGGGRMPNTSSLPVEFQKPLEFDAYPIFNAQVTKYFRWGSAYVGAENLANYTQENPIIDSHNPFGNNFDASMIWGPLHGRKIFVGIRFAINRDEK